MCWQQGTVGFAWVDVVGGPGVAVDWAFAADPAFGGSGSYYCCSLFVVALVVGSVGVALLVVAGGAGGAAGGVCCELFAGEARPTDGHGVGLVSVGVVDRPPLWGFRRLFVWVG